MEEKVKFFQGLDPQNKCEELSENHDIAIELETISLSEYSPGIVKSSEYIARMIFSPLHIEENGTIKPSAFSDVKDKGLSVHRLNYIRCKELESLGKTMASNANTAGRSERDYIGYVRAHTTEIRQLTVDNKRLFCVYDTAKETKRSHADVCAVFLDEQQDPQLSKKAANKRRRKRLQELFSTLISC
ncbi:MAG TPA: hypothetical protein EYG81_02785 [Archaeoglobus profundus]|nr:hypothetical protein [Archaeoglobus profundus]